MVVFMFMERTALLRRGKRGKRLKREEVMRLIIMLACVMRGRMGWGIYGLWIEDILSRYVVMLFGFTGGGSVG
uniref:hypothetical protein n=1 Tax=Siminovitchia fortis TaxID=254758 RepID=UPI0021B2E642